MDLPKHLRQKRDNELGEKKEKNVNIDESINREEISIKKKNILGDGDPKNRTQTDG